MSASESWECACGQSNPPTAVVCVDGCWKPRYTAEGNYTLCIYCGVDCEGYNESEHSAICPLATGLYLVTPDALGYRGPNDPYAHGMSCMDCGDAFSVGDIYALRVIEGDDVCFEVVCVGCRVLNPAGVTP